MLKTAIEVMALVSFVTGTAAWVFKGDVATGAFFVSQATFLMVVARHK